MGDLQTEPFQFTFNGFLKVAFQGSRIPSHTGTIAAIGQPVIGHTVHAAVDTSGKPSGKPSGKSCRLPARVGDILA